MHFVQIAQATRLKPDLSLTFLVTAMFSILSRRYTMHCKPGFDLSQSGVAQIRRRRTLSLSIRSLLSSCSLSPGPYRQLLQGSARSEHA